MQEFYSDKTSQFMNKLWHWRRYKIFFMMVYKGTTINLKKTIPCMCTASFIVSKYRKDNLHTVNVVLMIESILNSVKSANHHFNKFLSASAWFT